jgi:hypothetical protein
VENANRHPAINPHNVYKYISITTKAQKHINRIESNQIM